MYIRIFISIYILTVSQTQGGKIAHIKEKQKQIFEKRQKNRQFKNAYKKQIFTWQKYTFFKNLDDPRMCAYTYPV